MRGEIDVLDAKAQRANYEELSGAIAGFEKAMQWP
jgi:hypothetical protein